MSATSTTTTERRYETMQSAAERTGLSVKSIRRRIAEGHLTAYRLGQRVIRVDPSEVDAMFTRTDAWAVA
ncbi:helix-turn-helix transcriptional regulator [Corynebacterium variabile]|uniref:helix-turn-helix transcriptional regulator n=1 Tax=Corynebacterium variabile TaxID=1727 RepID=UPI003FD10E83